MNPELIIVLWSAVLAAYLVVEIALTALNMRHVTAVAAGGPPAFLRGRIDAETFGKSVDYTLARSRLHLCGHVYLSVFLFCFGASGAFGALEAVVADAVAAPLFRGVLSILIVGLIFDLAAVPVQLYSVFVIEQRFGFNRMTAGLWLRDKVKGSLIALLLCAPLLLAVLWFIRAAGSLWWLYAFCFIALFELTVAYLYPIWIAPLFNEFTPLSDQKLRARILALAEKLAYRLADVFVMDGSKRSSHANAYFTGFGRHKRVVLFDTLIETLKEDELLAVFAHEIGHQKKRHVIKGLALALVLLAVGLFVLDVLLNCEPLYAAFGFERPAAHAAIVLIVFAAGPFTYFLSPLFAILSRRYEYEADRFAVDAVGEAQSLDDALVALSRKSLSNYMPHPLYSFFHYSHPALSERLAAIHAYQQQRLSISASTSGAG